jgi:carbonic anhydrase
MGMDNQAGNHIEYTADDFDIDAHVSAKDALARLKDGNHVYQNTLDHTLDLSTERIAHLFEHGQRPFACVITCSDSRVIPEHIFMTGLGEIFVIRVAGNVIGELERASAYYACEHLHTRLLLVLGHTHCGAIKAALDGEGGAVAPITAKIADAIGDVSDPYEASVLNTRAAIHELQSMPELAHLIESHDLVISGAIYHTHSGAVDFLE